MALKQELAQKMLQKLSPQQIQFIKLLQLNTLDFEEKVSQELLDNPALEPGDKVDDPEDFKFEREAGSEKQAESDFGDDAEDKAWEDHQQEINVEELLRAGGEDEYGSFRMGEDYQNEDQKEMPIASQGTFYEYLVEQADATVTDEKQ